MLSNQEYPHFTGSLVVDSHFDSRKRLLEHLRQSGLFDTIVEAQSFMHGIEVLSSGSVDACFLGSSISLDGSIHFIRCGRMVVPDDDCVFIALMPDLDEEEILNRKLKLFEAGVHQVITDSYSQEEFKELVVSTFQVLVQTGRNICRMAQESEALTHSAFSIPREVHTESLSDRLFFAAMLLEQIADDICCGELSMNIDGSATPEVQQEIQEAFNKILGVAAQGGGSQEWNSSLSYHLAEWFATATLAPSKIAREYLRIRLLMSSTH